MAPCRHSGCCAQHLLSVSTQHTGTTTNITTGPASLSLSRLVSRFACSLPRLPWVFLRQPKSVSAQQKTHHICTISHMPAQFRSVSTQHTGATTNITTGSASLLLPRLINRLSCSLPRHSWVFLRQQKSFSAPQKNHHICIISHTPKQFRCRRALHQ